MTLTVGELRRLLNGKDPHAEVHLAVEGYETAELRSKLREVDGFVLLCLAPGSEIVEVLDECDILR